MLSNRKFKKIALLVFLSFAAVACDNDDDSGDVIIDEPTIADVIAEDANYSSLLAALEITGLTSALSADTELTLFAPTNAAFNAFLASTGFDGLEAVPEDVLSQVLLNHVLSGAVYAGDISTGYVETLATMSPGENNLSMYINVGDNVTVNGGAQVIEADIEADNGVIHGVDAVIGLPDITTFATADPTFDVLVQALTRDDDFDFVATLQTQESPAPFTVFAPTNEAFVAFLEEFDFDSLDDVPSGALASVLSYHVVTEANVRSEDITDGMDVGTFEGGNFMINAGDQVSITDEMDRVSTVVATDVQATNGVIHVIDTVLFPDLDN